MQWINWKLVSLRKLSLSMKLDFSQYIPRVSRVTDPTKDITAWHLDEETYANDNFIQWINEKLVRMGKISLWRNFHISHSLFGYRVSETLKVRKKLSADHVRNSIQEILNRFRYSCGERCLLLVLSWWRGFGVETKLVVTLTCLQRFIGHFLPLRLHLFFSHSDLWRRFESQPRDTKLLELLGCRVFQIFRQLKQRDISTKNPVRIIII